MAGLFDTDDTTGATVTGRYARVAPEQAVDAHPDGLTYAVPASLMDLQPGDRVRVPLGRGNKLVSGFVLDVNDRTDLDPAKLKGVHERDAGAVQLPADLVELARWISNYYCCPLGMVFASMLPAAVKRGVGRVQRRLVELADSLDPSGLEQHITDHAIPAKQADVLRHAVTLDAQGALPVDPKALAFAAGAKTAGPVGKLVSRGLLQYVTRAEVRAIWAEHAVEPTRDLTLNEDQQRAVDAIVESRGAGFGVHLLHGVTGSGKTEVYIRAIEPVVRDEKTAIVLVPEIALTPQTVGRFIGRFPRVAVLHSGLTAAQRHEQWQLIRDGWAQVVVGARSAVFAPVQRPGLIIVDEEHDNSYKQDQAPRYHGRDVAIKRAHAAGIPIVLGSATPSLESYFNATERGAYTLLNLPHRVSDQKMPPVQIVDMLEERRRRYEHNARFGDRNVHLLSLRLEQALHDTFDAGGQAIVLLNRRGYANYIACPDHQCGWMLRCNHCDVSMVYHLRHDVPTGGLVRCHYCNTEQRLPRTCPICGKQVSVFGLGTQRVEREIESKFPNLNMLRMDSDAMRTGRDYEKSLREFREGRVQLLLGTQMIAKGLDVPNVRLVGVISADTALNLPDFRATERTFQLVAQVAGRSGRGAAGGCVVVQTFTPGNPAIELAAQHDYVAFAEMELQQRHRAQLPPVTRMARIVVRHEKLEAAQADAQALAEALRESDERMGLGVRVIGPVPAPIERIGDYHRQQITLIAADAATLQQLIVALRNAGLVRSDVHMAVDVDPVSLL